MCEWNVLDVKNVKSGKEDGMNTSGPNRPPQNAPEQFGSSFRDRSPIRREPEMAPRGRESGRGLRDFGGRERDWNRGRELEPFPGDGPHHMDHDRDLMQHPYAPPVDPQRANFG